MNTLRLPDALVAYLRKRQRLQYDTARCECGQIELLPLEQLKLGEVWVSSDNSPLAESDPHVGEDGYYPVPSVNLVADAEGYDAEGILVWLPELQLFGSWDLDHWDLYVFPGVTWGQIAADPLPFVNAQWYPENVRLEYFKPWPRYLFKRGRPF